MLPTNWGRSQALAVISPRKQNGPDHAAEAVAGLHHRMNYLGLKMLSWADLILKSGIAGRLLGTVMNWIISSIMTPTVGTKYLRF